MKQFILVIPLLFLSACEGSSARGFWGPNAPTGAWDREQMRPCELYGNCDGAATDSGAAAGNAESGADATGWWWKGLGTGESNSGTAPNTEAKGCELYGNCE